MGDVNHHILELLQGLNELESLFQSKDNGTTDTRTPQDSVQMVIQEQTACLASKRQKIDDSDSDTSQGSVKGEDKFSLYSSNGSGFVTETSCSDRDGCLSSFSGSPLSIPDFEYHYQACSPIRPLSRTSVASSMSSPLNAATSDAATPNTCQDASRDPPLPDMFLQGQVSASSTADNPSALNFHSTESSNNMTPHRRHFREPETLSMMSELSSKNEAMITDGTSRHCVSAGGQSSKPALGEVSPLSSYDRFQPVMDISEKIKIEELVTASCSQSLGASKKLCAVCGATATGMYFGAIVCLPCKSFFIRCTKEGEPINLKCQNDVNCGLSGLLRHRCQYCRFQCCLAAGMCRKEKPEIVQPAMGQSLCKVCGDIANGIHFGVNTCEGCKKFFRRGLKEAHMYLCKEGESCPVTPRSRNSCRYCRYKKCVTAGMSRDAIKMGRPRKSSDFDQQKSSLSIASVSVDQLNDVENHLMAVEDVVFDDRATADSLSFSNRAALELKQGDNGLNKYGNSTTHLDQHNTFYTAKPTRRNLVTASCESIATANNPRCSSKSLNFDGKGEMGSLTLKSHKSFSCGRLSDRESQILKRCLSFQQSLSAPGGLSTDSGDNHSSVYEDLKKEKYQSSCHLGDSDFSHNPSQASLQQYQSRPPTQCSSANQQEPFNLSTRSRDNTYGGRQHVSNISTSMDHDHSSSLSSNAYIDMLVQEAAARRDNIKYGGAIHMTSRRKEATTVSSVPGLHSGAQQNSRFNGLERGEGRDDIRRRVNLQEFNPLNNSNLNKLPVEQNVTQLNTPSDTQQDAINVSNDVKECLDYMVGNYQEMIRKCDEASVMLDLRKNSFKRMKNVSATVLTEIQQGIIPNTHAQIWFASRVPGFRELCQEDQIVLLRYGAFQVGVVWASLRMFSPEQLKFRNFKSARLPPEHPMELFQTQLYLLGEKLHATEMDDREASMLCALILLTGDYLELKETDKIQRQYTSLLVALHAYILGKHGMKKPSRLNDLVSFIPKLRHLGIWFTHLMKFIHMEQSEEAPNLNFGISQACST